jgi:uncharacterized SAM-binding protein YcdF (DUF218 family)
MGKRAQIAGGVAIGAAYAAFLGLLLFAAQAFRLPNVALSSIQPDDGVVVLTGGENRVREGLKLMTGAPARRVLISGVYPSTSHDDFRRHFAISPVLVSCCLDIGYLAQDTVGNAEETRAWAGTWGFQRLIIVTSAYHMPRSLLELRRALPDTELIPHPVASTRDAKARWWLDGVMIRRVVTEYIKFLVAAVRP